METETTLSKSDFAKLTGVTPARVSQWIRDRVLTKDALVGEGQRAKIRVELAKVMLKQNLDPDRSPLGGGDKAGLTASRTKVVDLQREFLQLKLDEAKGRLISRAATLDAYIAFGLAVQRLFQSGAGEWSEELYNMARAENTTLGAFACMLRSKLLELNDALADLYKAQMDEYEPEGAADA